MWTIYLSLAVVALSISGAHAAVCPERSVASLGALHAGSGPSPDGLTLSHAQQLMRERNRELQLARRAVDAAKADTVRAAQAPNPNLTLQTFNINPAQGVGPNGLRSKAVDSTIRIDQLIERGGKRELRTSQAQLLEGASAEDLADALRQSSLAVSAAYYDLLLAQERVSISRELAELFSQTLVAAERRLKAGDIASAEVSRIRVDALRAQNDARNAEADRIRAQGALAYLIGVDGQAPTLCASDEWPTPGSVPVLSAGEVLIDRRPDVRAARARVEAAVRARELARSLRTRDISVGLQYEHWPQNGDNFQGTGNSYGIALSIPLFTRNYFEGEIQRAEADYGAAFDTLARVRAQAQADLARALADLNAASERLQRYEQALLVEAGKAAESAEFAYRNGAIGVMDLLDARRTLRGIRNDATQARGDFAKALAAWEAANISAGSAPATGMVRDGPETVR